MELSPRLLKIASIVPNGITLADVGTDHGYIPLYLLENKIITKAIAMDVNPMPLKKSQDNITAAGLNDKCEFRLSDGLANLSVGEADYIVIAGMGGLLIRDILLRGDSVIDKNTTLLLQPMIAAPELRLYLFENGFNIVNEYIVREETKYYNIIMAKRGKATYLPEDIYIGKNTWQNSREVFDDYIKYKLKVCTKIINGIKKSKNPDLDEIGKYQKEYDLYKSFKREG